jgi:hypothetical protein
MANAAGLNANANLAGGRICQRALSEIKNAWSRNFNRFVCSAHLCSNSFLAQPPQPPPVNDYGGVFISCLCPCEVARAAYKCVISQQEHYLSASLVLSSKQTEFCGAEVLE